MSARHKPRILKHLLGLKPEDRYLRFGYSATDEQIARYVMGLNFERDEIFGVFNRRLELVAMAHLAFSIDPQWATCAEFGVSVASHQRGKGLGVRLFNHAVMHARNEGVSMIFIHALSENVAMTPPNFSAMSNWTSLYKFLSKFAYSSSTSSLIFFGMTSLNSLGHLPVLIWSEA
jgi:GNAT superfamily N-acetyltransferase